MPSLRITIASNAKQSSKSVLLIPASTSFDPDTSSSCRTLILASAKTKLRLKKPTRIFIRGGKELLSEEDWTNVLKDDATLLVSSGEEYVGARTEDAVTNGTSQEDGSLSGTADINPECPIEILADKAFVDETSLRQLETTARTLPGIIHACGQPDLHPGNKFPIGGVWVSKDWIHPPLIGGDIGCGMAWYKTSLTRAQVEGDKGRKIAEKLRGLEGLWRTQRDRENWLATHGEETCTAGERWDKSLGTIGAGNHFAELQVVEESRAPSEATDPQHQLHEGKVVLLVHSGSRGYGGDILDRFTLNNRTSIHNSEPLAGAYLAEHDRACDWASRNRDLIALRFLCCLEPGDEAWSLGLNIPNESISATSVHAARASVSSRKVVDMWHNNMSVTLWPPLPPSHAATPSISAELASTTLDPPPNQQQVYIHRKGAAPTYNPSKNLPISVLPLPGSRATPTLILHPTFPASTSYGLINALSLAHGAGRAMSRAKAAEKMAKKYKGKGEDLLRGDFVAKDNHGNQQTGGGDDGKDVHGGTWVVCEDKQLVWEEAGEAYKDVWAVGEDLVAKGVCERWGWCRGRVSYKVRKE